MQKPWNTINEVLLTKSAVYNIFITTEGNCCTDKNVIVNEFNKYFTNIGQNLNAKLIQPVHDPTHYINKNPANFFLYTNLSH